MIPKIGLTDITIIKANAMNQFKNLEIWNRSVSMATAVYECTQGFPNEEKYGLVSQMRRSAVSLGSNIAEGAGRSSNKDFNRFLWIAYSSSYELETQLIIAEKLGYLSKPRSKALCNELDELQKMIYSFANVIRNS